MLSSSGEKMEKGIIVLWLISSFVRWQDTFHVLERRQGSVGVTMRQIGEISSREEPIAWKDMMFYLVLYFFLLNTVKGNCALQFSAGEGFKDKYINALQVISGHCLLDFSICPTLRRNDGEIILQRWKWRLQPQISTIRGRL